MESPSGEFGKLDAIVSHLVCPVKRVAMRAGFPPAIAVRPAVALRVGSRLPRNLAVIRPVFGVADGMAAPGGA